MPYETIVSVYTAILGVIISIFGISIAAIIALTQVLQPVLAHSQTRKVLKSKPVISTGIFMTISLLLASGGILGLAFQHDLFPDKDYDLDSKLSSLWYLIILLILIMTTVGMTIYVFYKQTALLVPTKALKNFKDNIKMDEVRKYFGYKNAVRPFPPMNKYIIKFGDDEDGDDEGDEAEAKALEEKYKSELAEYEAHKKEFELLVNPISPIESYLFASLKKGDLSAFIDTLKTIEALIKLASEDKESDKITHELISYYCKVLERIAESAISDGSISFLSEALESSHRVASYLLTTNKLNPINSLQAYWKNAAYDSMSTLPIIFKQIMEIYRDVGETLLRKGNDGEQRGDFEVLNNIFRSLGWVGEKYLEKNQPERNALMNSDHQTEFSSLMNAVLGFGWIYQNEHAEKGYPHIYFDCLYVIGKSLIDYYQPEGDGDSYANDISQSLFSLMYEHESFGEAASNAKNANGAWLSMKGLSDFIRIFESNPKANELKKNALEGVLRLGAAAFANDITERAEYGLDSVPDYSLKLIRKHGDDVDLSHEGMEIYIKSHGNMDKVKEYLKLAQPVAGTTFGLNLTDE